MKKAYIFLADGFEEVEGLTAVDLLRRAGIEVVMVSIKDDVNIKGARGINVVADTTISESLTDADMVILPGGMPGTNYLKASDEVKNLVNAYNDAGKYVAAICAAPTVFGEMGILQGKKATCYPGLEHGLLGAMLPGEDYSVVQDGNIITSRGVGTAIDFALKLIEVLIDKKKADEIAESIVY
ncbi:MAG: DJ-1/PfpI family protein [Eubacterium sp.]|nr:DJ-1/PfpI family protein [Eubacterium sp.]